MFQPSEGWTNFGSWEKFCETKPSFSAILVSKIPELASKYNHGKSCSITPGRYASGGLNVVFELVFEDDIVWLCRAGWIGYQNDYVKALMESTVATMRYLRKHSELPIPEVYAYESEPAKSEIGATYMFLEPFPGTASNEPVPEEHQPAIQRKVAYVASATSRHTFARIGWLRETDDGGFDIGPMTDENGKEYGPFDSSVEFFQDYAQRLQLEYVSSATSEVTKESLFTCWLYKQLTLRLDTNNHGPFPLMHPEPSQSQILLGENFEINGVIDWDRSGTFHGCC
jgi:hypothetical protein